MFESGFEFLANLIKFHQEGNVGWYNDFFKVDKDGDVFEYPYGDVPPRWVAHIGSRDTGCYNLVAEFSVNTNAVRPLHEESVYPYRTYEVVRETLANNKWETEVVARGISYEQAEAMESMAGENWFQHSREMV